MASADGRPRVSLTPSGIGQYINYAGCPRFFRLKYFDQAIVNDRNWFDPTTTSDLFAEIGISFEEDQLATLAERSSKVVGDAESDGEPVAFDETWTQTVERGGDDTEAVDAVWEEATRDHLEELIEEAATLSSSDDPITLFQLPMYGQLGVWDINGIADLITLDRASDGRIRSRILEVKTAWKDKTAHQIQAVIYSLMLDDLVQELGFEHEPMAAVVNRDVPLRDIQLADLDYIDRASRSAEIQRLLKRNGELHELAQQSFEDVGYRLERKCDSCPYNAVCFTRAIESADPALLNLTQGDQRRFAAHGVTRLHDVAELYERDPDTRPIDYDPLEPQDEALVRPLETKGPLGDRLDEIVQRAQVLRGEIDPTYERFDDVQYLKGTGQGTLPDDDPHPSLDPPYERGSLIRVYLYVQKDHVRDRLALLAGRINGNQIDSHEVVSFTDSLETDREASLEEEERLLRDFFGKLFTELNDTTDESEGDDEANVHLYFYSSQERDALMDAVERQPAAFGSHAIRDLLGLREGIDQRMVSVVHSDITKRLALRYPGTGLVQTVGQLRAFAGDESHDKWQFGDDQWMIDRDGEELDLQSIFRTGLFERWRPYAEAGDSISLLLGDSDEDAAPEGWYPLHNRFGNQIPLEYLWGVHGKLADIAEESADDREPVGGFATYQYRDGEEGDRITEADVTALALKLCEALEHVERSIEYKNWKLDKNPLSIPELPDFGLRDASLADACQEYLDLEYATNRQECLEHYLGPPRQRVQSGESAIFRVTSVRDTGGYDIRVTGDLLYDDLFEEPEHVIDGCRIKGGDEGGSGSWRVMTKLERTPDGGFEHVNAQYPDYIENSAKATVETFDRQARDIVVNASTFGGFGKGRYLQWHRNATTDPDDAGDYDTLIQEGDLFILDPYADDWTSHRSYAALEHTDSNALYHLLNDAFTDGKTDQLESTFCSQEAIDDYLSTVKDATDAGPLGRQREFVRKVDHAVSVLQGPPGTGKTSYTLAPAVLARLWAAEQDGRRLVTVVTAPSHTAVDEALTDVADRWAEVNDATGMLDDTRFVRVLSGDRDTDPLPNVEYRSYYDSDDVDQVAGSLDPHASPDRTAHDHLVLFTTTPSLRGVIDKVSGPVFNADSAEDVMAQGDSFVDLLVIDEASMLDLSQTLLASTYLKDSGQTLLIGDHRQMEPVQQHDWDGEDRRTIEENVPFMSALNFVRFLRGELDEVEYAVPSSPEVGDAIPITRLDRTYRLHKLVADLLTDLVYTDDGIKLRSDQTELLPAIQSSTAGVEAAMDPEYPVALIIHDENESQDANRTEVALVQALLSALPETDSFGEIGVVTPHNAQKGRLLEAVGDRVTADTVERFQGGEREVMFISATASDPDYVRSEADFLLDPHRLNVAMSRMKQKLVIVASESVFGVTPTDANKFDQTLIWKRLYAAMGITADEPSTQVWSGTLAEFCPEHTGAAATHDQTELDLYALKAESNR